MSDNKKTAQSGHENDETLDVDGLNPAHSDGNDRTMDFDTSAKIEADDQTLDFDAPESENDQEVMEETFVHSSEATDESTVDFDTNQQDEKTSLFEPSVGPTRMTRNEIVERRAKKTRRRVASAIGTTIGEYQVVSELGRGGMGVVYRARHQKLQRDVALKMILTGSHSSGEALDRFLLEARAVAHLQHPNIVQIFDIGEHKGLPYFTLEFVDGEPLDDVIAEEPLSSRGAAKIVLTLATAMQYAHDEGILHRDIKPANILMAKDGTPKITDFGLAKEVDGDSGATRDGQIMGTPSYMSPEQAQGQVEQLGPSTDQYSLGALLYRLVSGRAPFAAAKPLETVMQVINNEPVPPRQLQPDISVDLETICLKTLQKDPAARYANCSELADDLRRFLNGEPIHARPISGPERFWRWCKRNPRVAIPSAVAIAMMICATAVSSWAYVKVSGQNIVIKKEKKIAQAQEQIAKKQTEIAEEKTRVAFQQAENGLEIIQDTISNVNNRLATDPKLNDLRVEICKSLSKSLDRIDPMLLEDEESEAIPTLMAIRHEMISIFDKEGNYEDALRDCKMVYQMAKRRITVRQGSDAARLNLARVAMTFSSLIDKVERDSDKSAEYLNEALALVVDIIENPKPRANVENIKPWSVHYTWGAILQNLGAMRYRQGDLEQFNEHFEEAVSVYQDWLKTFTHDEAFLSLDEKERTKEIANVESNLNRLAIGLATYQFKTSMFEEAFKNFEIVLARAKARFESDKQTPMDRVNFQQSSDMVGFNKLKAAMLEVENRESRLKESEDLLATALKVATQLVTDYPKSTDLKYNLALAHYRSGILREYQGRSELAQTHFNDCYEIRKKLDADAPSEKHNNMLMVIEGRVGNWETARQMADDKAAAEPDAAQWVRIARGYALAANSEGAPKEELVSASIAAIESAIANDFKDWFDLVAEPDLEAIKKDQRFLEQIAKIKPKNTD